MTYLWLATGLVILVAGAEVLVRGAVALAQIARISPLVIGLTVVAFGTSAPELAVSSVSSLKGESEIALGNVIGSNLFNTLVILGLSALIIPLSVSSQLVRLDVPIMVVASFVAWLAAASGTIGRWEGITMFGAFLLYTGWLVRAGRREHTASLLPTDAPPPPTTLATLLINLGLLVAGLIMLVLGAQLLVEAAAEIARQFGVSELVIGLTIVAAGTSLPELATSVVAAVKGERDIAVGNVVGSNLFNLMMVLAVAGMLAPAGVPVASEVLWFDLASMTIVAMICWPIFQSYATVTRIEGATLFGLYLTYTALLVGEALDWPQIATFKSAFALGVLPTLLILTSLLAWRAARRQPKQTIRTGQSDTADSA